MPMHQSVLLKEAVDALQVEPDGFYVDATFGRGGHARAILSSLGQGGHILALDRDPDAVQVAGERFGGDERFAIENRPFSMLSETVKQYGYANKVDGILFDLGVSSPQLNEAERGFSFQLDGPLDMRMDTRTGQTAAQWLQHAAEEDISRVLKELGEERFARRIARAIVHGREQRAITRTGQLVEIIENAVPTRERKKHPATRSFQAIRLHINQELQELQHGLEQALDVLAPGGRLAVISFHSLEDRMVKRFIRKHSSNDVYPPDLPIRETDLIRAPLKQIGKARRAGMVEVQQNPRARSAVLRIAERVT